MRSKHNLHRAWRDDYKGACEKSGAPRSQPMSSVIPLATAFAATTADVWRAALDTRSGAAAADPRVAGSLYAPRTDARPIVARTPGVPWRIVERVDAVEPPAAVQAAMSALADGATGIDLVFEASQHPLRQRIGGSAAATAVLLFGRLPEDVHLRVEAGSPTTTETEGYLKLAAASGAELIWSFDPAAACALGIRVSVDEAAMKALAATMNERGIAGAAAIADGRLWHAGGATEEQELGAVLASWLAYLRILGRATRIAVAIAADSDQFRTIAKIRAMRLLVARICEVAGVEPAPLRIHAETAWRTMSARDADVNILRATGAAFAAAVGGADSVTVLPHDAVTAAPGDAARRLARNTQIILAEEANVGRVADPGAGAGAIEAMTSALAEAAWRRFQSIEAEGGIVAAIAEKSLLREIAEAREARLARTARGDIKLVGVNAFRGDTAAATVKRALVKRTGPLTFKRIPAIFEGAP